MDVLHSCIDEYVCTRMHHVSVQWLCPAAINSGSIRHGIPRGPINTDLIELILPFDPFIVEGLLMGVDVRRMLEHSVSHLGQGGWIGGQFLAVEVRAFSLLL